MNRKENFVPVLLQISPDWVDELPKTIKRLHEMSPTSEVLNSRIILSTINNVLQTRALISQLPPTDNVVLFKAKK